MATQVDHAAIKTLGQNIVQHLNDAFTEYMKIDQLKSLAPGDFPDGDALKLAFDKRREEARQALAAITQAAMDIQAQLDAVSQKYEQTEDDNTITAAELDALITKVKAELPGVEL
ncbi:hypothetical protein ACWDV4_19670 [Micromonospora sp. NPDC003197]